MDPMIDTYEVDNLTGADATMRDALSAAGVEISHTHPGGNAEVAFEIPTPNGEGIVLGGEPCDDDANTIWWIARRHGRDEFLYEGTDMDACVAAVSSAVR